MTATSAPPSTLSDQAAGDSRLGPATRALTTTANPTAARADLAYEQIDLQRIAQHMYALMLRNVSSDGYPFTDSTHELVSLPGCVIAAPSYPANTPGISQDYVFNWVRDAAITALELDAAAAPQPGQPVEALVDYVSFADLCQATLLRPRDTPASPSTASLAPGRSRTTDPRSKPSPCWRSSRS